MTTPTSLLLISVTLLFLFPIFSISTDTLVPNQSLKDNQSETLVSAGKHFELGFFTPGTSKNRYLGIWYKNISPQTVVWIANRNTPITDSSGVLNMDQNGNLLLFNGSAKLVWSWNQSKQDNPKAEQVIGKLLDTGNFVVMKKSGEDDYVWQSFSHATDTLLPGMKLGWDLKTGLKNNSIVSWKSDDDPSAGDCSFVMDPHAQIAPEIYLIKNQSQIYRSGPWNGKQFSGVPEMKSQDDGISYNFSLNEDQKFYAFYLTNASIVSRLQVDSSGKIQRFLWSSDDGSWHSYWDAPKDKCDEYNHCGTYGICDSNDLHLCECVKGFQPRNNGAWENRVTSGGCVRMKQFVCGKDDGFLKLKGMKLPANSNTYYNDKISLKECRQMCERNCSCTAYANSHLTSDGGGGSGGCIFWIGDLVDLRVYANGGQDLYVRVAASELGQNHKNVALIIMAVVIPLTLLLGLTLCYMWRKRKLNRSAKERVNRIKSQEFPLFDMFHSGARDNSGEQNDDLELPLIDFDIIAAITEDFSDINLLGHGGFGSVYKGTLGDGQEVAVKRLSKYSGQGAEEFKNEVMLIAKLQHRNLVRLLGCCIDGEERMLIYEYMPNKSLDSFLFDKSKCSFLDWRKRFNIIMGVARGLLYLHQDSRFRIIHRDLKASNILLDDEMNPKISDFGMARIFGGDQTEANTRRVVGTYGYMAPEYAMDGLFSVKSDVFSYGVLMLEIISGTRNRGFYSGMSELNLLGHAWRLWEEGKGLELMDESLGDKWSSYEVLKCIQVGLLCVQEHAEDRPTISSVILMLGSESATLAQPKKPGFSLGKTPNGPYSSSNDQESCSVNQVTVTIVDAR